MVEKVVGLKTASALLQRMQLAQKAGLRFEGARDLYKVFGYKTKLDDNDFLAKYQRQDITGRIIDAPADALWSNPPQVLVGGSEPEAWKQLVQKFNIWSAINRADKLCRLGAYSLLVFGLNGRGGKLDSTVTGRVSFEDLIWIKPFGARSINEMVLNSDPSSPNFGMPEKYKAVLLDPQSSDSKTNHFISTTDVIIHASRAIHIVENPLDNDIIGTPTIEKIFNLLDDLLKVAGGTAETYWLTADKGMQANIDKEMELDPEDAKALADEIDEYQHQLRRFIRTRGVDLKVLEAETPNPKEVFGMLISLISGSTGIPQRILLGSEAGQLASEQDRGNWAERLTERRKLFAEPRLLKPVITKLQILGIIEQGEITFKWPEAFIMSPLEASQTMAQTARAIGNISRQTGNKSPMQLTSRVEARTLIGLEGDLAESDLILPPVDPDSDTDTNTDPNAIEDGMTQVEKDKIAAE